MKRAAILVLAIAACSPASDNEQSLTEKEAHPSTPEGLKELPIGARAPSSIGGEWRVAGVNGEVIDIAWAMTVTIDDDQINIKSQCMGFGRLYTLDGTALSAPEVESSDEPAPPVCLRMPLPEEKAVSKALQGADTAYRLPDQSLVLDGPEGSLTLFTQ